MNLIAKTTAVIFLGWIEIFSLGMVVTELYRDPAGKETELGAGLSHEFIEITNLGTDSIPFSGLCISNGSSADSLVHFSQSQAVSFDSCILDAQFLAPGRSVVVADRDYPSAASIHPLPFTSGAVVMTINDQAFGLSGFAADDGVVVYKGTRTRIDSILCIAADQEVVITPAGNGLTLAQAPEGISTVPFSVLSGNPLYSPGGDSCTPGVFENIKGGYIVEWHFGPVQASQGTVPCTLSYVNISAPDSNAAWKLTADNREIGSGTISGRNVQRSIVSIELASVRYLFTIKNTIRSVSWDILLSPVWSPENSVRINELFPRAQPDQPEWFELLNSSSMPIDIKGWKLGDSEDTVVLCDRSFNLDPGRIAVFTKDAAAFAAHYPAIRNVFQPLSWLTLDNYTDTLTLYNMAGALQDKGSYAAAWFPSWTSQSLERAGTGDGTMRESWALQDRPSPGQPNTTAMWRSGGVLSMNIGPVPFTPDNDGKNDLLAVILTVPAGYTGTLAIYGFDGRILRKFSGPLQERTFWDGKQENGHAAPAGPFFVVLDARTGTAGRKIIRNKGILWRK